MTYTYTILLSRTWIKLVILLLERPTSPFTSALIINILFKDIIYTCDYVSSTPTIPRDDSNLPCLLPNPLQSTR